MKTSLKFNLLQHLRRKQAEGGFTLIELLVVIIIIGILAAIALPSFLNQANRARETEASNAVGALNRGQQAYYLENVTFAPTANLLDVGVNTDSENYKFGNNVNGGTAGNFDTDQFNAVIYAAPKKQLRGYAGVAYLFSANNKQNSLAILCREKASDATDTQVAGSPTKATASAGANCGGSLEAVK